MKTTIPPVIALHGSDALTVEISIEASAHRDALIALAQDCRSVTSNEEARIASEVLKNVKAFTRTIEDSRKDVKTPVLDIGRQIDDLAKQLVSDLEAEATRISRVIGAFQAEEKRKADEIRRKAQAEEARITREAREDMAAAQTNAKNVNGFASACEQIERRVIQQTIHVRQEVANMMPTKPDGMALRENQCFEVTDIAALYAAAPHLCALSPNNAAIRAVLKSNPSLSIPGLNHWRESAAYVR